MTNRIAVSPKDIIHLRLLHQHIARAKHKTVRALVGWMGAMQAQDFSMSKWAIGLRLPDKTEKNIQKSFDQGDILRTHLLRPTWHLVSSGDIRWMAGLTAPKIRASMRSRLRELGITDQVAKKGHHIIEQALLKTPCLSRDELINCLNQHGIPTHGDNRASHIFMLAELAGLICSGPLKGNKSTYALLSRRASASEPLIRNQALSMLALRYFRSHGPATLPDFIWWSGLGIKDAQAAVQMNGSKLTAITSGAKQYWLAANHIPTTRMPPAAFLLPAFDEMIISYKDRSALLAADHHKKVISSNGLFRPVILVGGVAAGVWKGIAKKRDVVVEAALFQPLNKKQRSLIEEAAEKYGAFLEKKATVHYR